MSGQRQRFLAAARSGATSSTVLPVKAVPSSSGPLHRSLRQQLYFNEFSSNLLEMNSKLQSSYRQH